MWKIAGILNTRDAFLTRKHERKFQKDCYNKSKIEKKFYYCPWVRNKYNTASEPTDPAHAGASAVVRLPYRLPSDTGQILAQINVQNEVQVKELGLTWNKNKKSKNGP